MTFGTTARTEDEGLLHVYRQINRMGHIWRDFLRHDVGIDLVLEIVADKKATGLLIAAQVKSGDSYFRREKDGKVQVRSSHLRYWCEYGLPVIIVAYSPTLKRAYWKEIDTLMLLDAEGRGSSVEIDLDQLFDAGSSLALVSICKEFRNKARGFSESCRILSDEAKRNQWGRLTKILHKLLTRSLEDFLPAFSLGESHEDVYDRENKTNDALFHWAEFLGHLIRYDVSAEECSSKYSRFDPNMLSELQAILMKCRKAWHGTDLETWLLKELGGFVGEWREDVLALLRSSGMEIENGFDLNCPVCYFAYGNEHVEDEDLSYSLGGISHDIYRVHTVCARCGTPFSYKLGMSGLAPAVLEALRNRAEAESNDSNDVPF